MVFDMSTRIYVCNGCCCGRIEKGNNKVPIEELKSAWQKHELDKTVKLTISGCLGPCSMNNVSLIKDDLGQTWLGKLSGKEHYDALVTWALDVEQKAANAELPKILADLKFDREPLI